MIVELNMEMINGFMVIFIVMIAGFIVAWLNKKELK